MTDEFDDLDWDNGEDTVIEVECLGACGFATPVLINDDALVVRYNGNHYFPIVKFYAPATFGLDSFGEPNYRDLKRQFAEAGQGKLFVVVLTPALLADFLRALLPCLADGADYPAIAYTLTVSRKRGAYGCALVGRDAAPALHGTPAPDVPLGMYLHIPFCRKRCHFCYFRVYTDRNAEEVGAYLDVLAREWELNALAERLEGLAKEKTA